MIKKSLPLMLANITMLLLQAFQFFLLARLLGAEQFGLVSAVTALVTILVPLSDFGFGNLLLRHSSINNNAATKFLLTGYLSNILIAFFLTIITVIAAKYLYHGKISLLLVSTIALSEFLFFRSVWITGQYHAALDDLKVTSLFTALIPFCRILGVLPLLFIDDKNPIYWSLTMLSFAILTYVITVAKAYFTITDKRGVSFKSFWKESLSFCLSDMSRNLSTDLDKVLLGHYSPGLILGPYTAAYRLVSFASMPVKSLLQSMRSKIYKDGVNGNAAIKPIVVKIFKVCLPYSLLSGVGIFILAPLVVNILGPSYESSINLLKYFSVLPLVQLISFTSSEVLAGLGKVGLRLKIQIFTNSVFFIVALYLIGSNGSNGAVLSVYFGEILLSLTQWGAIYFQSKR